MNSASPRNRFSGDTHLLRFRMEGAMLPTDAAGWKPVFDFLEQETKFQAAAAAITATAAAWWVKALIAKDAKEPAHPRASRLAALLLLIVAFTFYINEGRLAAKYGTLARAITIAQPIPGELANSL